MTQAQVRAVQQLERELSSSQPNAGVRPVCCPRRRPNQSGTSSTRPRKTPAAKRMRATSPLPPANNVTIEGSTACAAKNLNSETCATPLTLMDLLFFDIFFDFCVAPAIEQNSCQNPLEAATAAALSCCPPTAIPLSSTLSRLRTGLFKYQLLQTFITQTSIALPALPHTTQNQHLENLFALFVQSAQSLGVSFL